MKICTAAAPERIVIRTAATPAIRRTRRTARCRVPRTRAGPTTPCTGRTSRCRANRTWTLSQRSGTWTPSTRASCTRWTRGRPFTCRGRRRRRSRPRPPPHDRPTPPRDRRSRSRGRFCRQDSKTCFRQRACTITTIGAPFSRRYRQRTRLPTVS